jgi:hypothetical protein
LVDDLKPTSDVNVEVVDILEINIQLGPEDFHIHHNAFGEFDGEALT